ncbi:MAG: type II secretion system F family protein [Candidatus ainarchaeum sp.]|nr:type II secretion system F family protein [Candidatus ainarchaeum sp.]
MSFDLNDKMQEKVDLKQVESIVENIKRKYEEKGLSNDLESLRLQELRSIISEGKRSQIEVQKPEELSADYNKGVKLIGKIYNSFSSFFSLFSKRILSILPGRNELSMDLDSANINYSTAQYLAITSVISLILTIIITAVAAALFAVIEIPQYYLVLVFFVAMFLTAGIVLKYPSIVAADRAKKIDAELPFALRHMATELRAGIGLYRVLQTIAIGEYGYLSEEMARVINEVEQGADTKDALKNLAYRTRSFSLRNTLNHILRALKSGGNLSEVLNNTANDVSFEIRLNLESFSGKMNFIGVIYIFIGIVIPVMLAILGTIRNIPLGGGVSLFASLPLTPTMIILLYVVILPICLIGLVMYIRKIRPTY